MRKVVFQFREIRPQGFESAVDRCLEKNLKLCTVDLVAVNLLVMEIDAADDRLGSEDLSAVCA
jgi:hypothetical protein